MNPIKNPRVTVLMPVYNGEKYLREAIDSILSQTFSDFEFLIIDDGSTDTSAEIIKLYTDSRIVYIKNETNKGLPYSLNRGLDLAKGTYIARMDCDDISLPTRLAEQVAYMEVNPTVGILSAWMRTMGAPDGYLMKSFTDNEDIRANLLFNTSLSHPTIFIRAKAFQGAALRYDPTLTHGAEDYDLWERASHVTRFACIPKVLVRYRIHGKNMSSSKSVGASRTARDIRLRQITALGLTPTENELSLHSSLRCPDDNIADFLSREEQWFKKIVAANDERHIYKDESLQKVLHHRWFLICDANTRMGLSILFRARKSPFAFSLREIGFVSYLKFKLKAFLRK